MITKLDQIKALWNADDRIGALRIAARFPRLGDDGDAIRRAWDAHQRPSFYRQINRDPDAIVADGLAALAHRYTLVYP